MADPYGLGLSGLPPDVALRAQGLSRNDALLNAMLQQSMSPIQQPVSGGKIASSVHPLQGVAKIVQAYMARQGLNENEQARKELSDQLRGGEQEAMANYIRTRSGVPAQPPIEQPPAEVGGGPARPEIPAVAPNPRAAVEQSVLSHYPGVQRLGQLDLASMNKDEQARKAEEFKRELEGLRAQLRGEMKDAGKSPEPLEPVVDPKTGKAKLVPRSQAAGMEPAKMNVPLQSDLAGGKKSAEVGAKDRTAAAIALPKIVSQGEETIRLVDDLLKHPGFGMAVGKTSLLGTQFVPGTDAHDFKLRLDQLLGKQFLAAYETLKGGGQITEIEGKKATDAMSRMKSTSSEKEFVKAAREFQEVVKVGMENARRRAGLDALLDKYK